MSSPSTPWLDAKEAALHCGFKTREAWQTILKWARKGFIPEQYIGLAGKGMRFKQEGLEIAMRKLRQRQLKRCGIKLREVA
jgi:hypothetical protein